MVRNKVCFCLICIFLISTIPAGAGASGDATDAGRALSEGVAGSDGTSAVEPNGAGEGDPVDISYGFSGGNSYDKYIVKYSGTPSPDHEIIIPGVSVSSSAGADTKVLDDYAGEKDVLQWSNQEGSLEWNVDIPEDGLYNMAMKYFPVEGKGSDIELELFIDGQLPFDGAVKFQFSRVWKDASGITRDSRGNDILPQQVEAPMWVEDDFKDTEGLYNDAYKFYFSKGRHTVRLTCIREAFMIAYLKIYQKKQPPAYREALEEYSGKGYRPVHDTAIKFQAENPLNKSDSTLHPIYDRSSSATEPGDPVKIRLNTIGGAYWEYPGQWITWQFEVPEDGLYKIAMRYKQAIVRGLYTTRKIYIDGTVPFEELSKVEFPYGSQWKIKVLGDDDPYLFHLSKGTHTITMEVVLGDIAQSLKVGEDSVYRLNYLYRKIIMITGVQPDLFRDYYLDREIPELVPGFNQIRETLTRESKRIVQLTGSQGSEAVLLDEISQQLKSLVERPDTINSRLDRYKSNIDNLSAWILRIKEQPLELDYIEVSSPEKALPKQSAGFFSQLVFQIKAFMGSFFEDYEHIGDITDKDRALKVWTATGRDQAEIIQNLIRNNFTPETGIEVNISLVKGSMVQTLNAANKPPPEQGALMQATMAGQGPEVALFVGRGEPVDLASRGSLVNLDSFGDFDGVSKRFFPESVIPYKYDGGCYALPQEQSFQMLFYRKDVFGELGIKPPQTWEDFYDILPVIQRNKMQVGLPYYFVDAFSLVSYGMGSLSLFPTLLLQNGCTFYKDGYKSTGFDDPDALKAFEEWTDFYTKYGFPLNYDFYSRFRTGEMPMGIAPYTFYNTFAAAAPEIRNLWDMVPIPGAKGANGKIDRSEGGSGTACVIFKTAKNRDGAWEFLKWWTSADTQAAYARDIEALMGPGARYDTANIEAFGKIPWSRPEYDNLMAQWKQVREIPEIPGGYYTSRNMDNAFRAVVLEWRNPRDTFFEYNREINLEIARKRQEFGLDR